MRINLRFTKRLSKFFYQAASQFGQEILENTSIYNINSVKPPIYRGVRFLKNHRRGQGRNFLVKTRGLPIIEGS